jgi:hypothetical protein
MTEDKPTVYLRAVNAQQIERKKLSLSRKSACLGLFNLIRKSLALKPEDSVFLYYKQFAIYPDTTISEIIEHSPGITEFDIQYSLAAQFG